MGKRKKDFTVTEPKTPPKKGCKVCEEAESKYKCPACLIPYCLLACFKKHEGVLEVIRISCVGYPINKSFIDFVNQFGLLVPGSAGETLLESERQRAEESEKK